MTPRARDKYGINVGPEVKWKGREPERSKRPVKARKWQPRPPVVKLPKPKPITHCTRPTCPYLKAEVMPGRTCCRACAAKLERRAGELREREERRTVEEQKRVGVREHPTHDREVSPDA